MRSLLAPVLVLSLAGCCCRPACPPPCPTPTAPRDARRPVSSETRREIVARLRVGMTYDEVVTALRPYTDGPAGAVGGLGLATFALKDGDLTLHFGGGGLTEFAERGAEFSSVPAFVRNADAARLVTGGDFVPEAAPSREPSTADLIDAAEAALREAFGQEVYDANIELAACLRQAADEKDPAVATTRHDACIWRFHARLDAAEERLVRAKQAASDALRGPHARPGARAPGEQRTPSPVPAGSGSSDGA